MLGKNLSDFNGDLKMNPKYNNIVSVLNHQNSLPDQIDKTLCLCDLCSEPGMYVCYYLLTPLTPLKLTDV